MADTATPWARRLRTAVGVVALLNLLAGLAEVVVATAIGSVSLFADAVDFGEDAAINALVFVALTLIKPDDNARRARWGKGLAVIVTLPAFAAAGQAIWKAFHAEPPSVTPLVLTAGVALLVNAACAVILSRFRSGHGSLATAAWLAARNDVLVNVAIIVMGLLTAWLIGVGSRWAAAPDLLLGVGIIGINLGAAKEVWEVAEQEKLADRALAGEDLDG